MRARSMLLGSAAMAGLFAPSALAADLQSAPAYKAAPAPAPVFSWTGIYIGANIGGAWGRSDVTTYTDCSPPLAGTTSLLCDNPAPVAAANVAAVNAAGTGPIKSSGITGGVQAGYNLQVDNIVYGVETDFGAFSLRGSRAGGGTIPLGFFLPAFTTMSSMQTDWLFTLRGRLGWATPTWLFYVTGGLAVTDLKVGGVLATSGFGSAERISTAKDKLGFAVGAGTEWALSRNWSLKAEYLFVDFGKVTASGFAAIIGQGFAYSQAISTTADLSAHVARVGINYRF